MNAADISYVVGAELAMKDHPGLQLGKRVSVFNIVGQLAAVLFRDQAELLAALWRSRSSLDCADMLGKLANGLMLKKLLKRKVQPSRARFSPYLNAANRISTKCKVIIGNSDLLDSEHFRPYLRHH